MAQRREWGVVQDPPSGSSRKSKGPGVDSQEGWCSRARWVSGGQREAEVDARQTPKGLSEPEESLHVIRGPGRLPGGE